MDLQDVPFLLSFPTATGQVHPLLTALFTASLALYSPSRQNKIGFLPVYDSDFNDASGARVT